MSVAKSIIARVIRLVLLLLSPIGGLVSGRSAARAREVLLTWSARVLRNGTGDSSDVA